MGRDVNLFLYSSWAIILLSHDLFEYFAVTGCQEGLGNNVKLETVLQLGPHEQRHKNVPAYDDAHSRKS